MGKSKVPHSIKPQRSWWASQSPILQHSLCFAALIGVAIYFCWATIFSGKSLVGGDVVQWRGVAQSMIEYREQTGEEPLWATNVFAGMPGYIISHAPLVPQIDELPKALRKISWPFSHVIFMLIGAYLLVWHLSRDTLSSLLAACAYSLTTYLPVILIAGHNTKFVALAFAPWLLLTFVYAIKKPNIIGSLLFTIALAVNLRAGHVQITYYITFLIFIWWIILLLQARKSKQLPDFFKATGLLSVGCVFALMMVSEFYWPKYEYKEFSIRGTSAGGSAGGMSWDYAMRWSQGPLEMLTLLIADAFGGSRNYWGPKPFTGGPHYVGGIVLFLASIALWRTRTRLTAALGIAGGLMVLFSFGRHFEVINRIMYNHFPLFDAFRAPETWLITVALVLAILAGLGLRYLVRIEPPGIAERAKWRSIYITLGIIGTIPLILISSGVNLFDFEREGERQQVLEYVAQSAQRNTSDPQVIAATDRLFMEQLVTPREDALIADSRRSLLFIFLTGIALFAYQRKILPSWALQSSLVLLVILDLGGVSTRYLNSDNLSLSKFSVNRVETFDVDQYILEQEGQYRVLSLERSDQTALSRASFHHESLGGYSGAKLRVYQDFLENILFDPRTGAPNSNALDMMNVRYIISPTPVIGTLDVEYGQQSGLTVYENLDALPRAFFVGEIEVIEDPNEAMRRLQENSFNPAINALLHSGIDSEITSIDSSSTINVNQVDYSPRKITYEVETDASRLLVLSEVYYPAGWEATLNGESIDIHRVNYLLRGVVVPAGQHTLEMTFNPTSYIWGKRLSLFSTIFVYGLAITLIGLQGYYRLNRNSKNSKH
ncbi:MAG: YfhO family protein [Bacteroidetes bacterium]|nr:YfhO family protein [Bacteroidota bacterium]